MDDGAKGDDGVDFCGGEARGGVWDFVGAGHPNDGGVFFLAAVSDNGVERAFEELAGEDGVEAADDDGEFRAVGGEVSVDFAVWHGGVFPWG